MITIKDLKKTYNKGKRNEHHALNGINLEIGSTGLVCILGESGSGKTTLLNTIGGLDTYNEGSIVVEEAKDYGYIFQNYYLLNDYSVAYNVKLALNPYELSEEEKDARVEYVLSMLGILKYKKKPVSMLSGGQRQRVSIARALVKSPTIIFADEPTGNLDEENTIRTMSILKSISKECLVLLVTHERRIANFFADRIIEVADGKIIRDHLHKSDEAYSRSDDANIYTKELQKQSFEEKLAQFNVFYRDELPDSLRLNLAYVDGKLYIQNLSACDIVLCGQESGVEMVDDFAPKFDMEDVEKLSYKLDKVKSKKKASLPFKEIKRLAIQNLRTLGRKQSFILAVFCLSAILLTITLAQFVSTKKVNEAEVVTTDSHYISLSFEKVSSVRGEENQKKILEFAEKYLNDQSLGQAFYLPSQNLYLQAFGLQQMNNITQLVNNFSFVDIERIGENDLIEGRMPQTRNEVVIDKRVLQAIMKSNKVVSSMYEKMTDYLGIEFMVTAHDTRLKIVGISDTKEPNIYACQNLLLGLDAKGYNVASVEEYEKELEADKLTGGHFQLEDNQILLRKGLYGALKKEEYAFGDRVYQVVGYFPDECGFDFVISESQCQYLRNMMIYNSKKVCLYSDNISQSMEKLTEYAKDYKSAFKLVMTVPHDNQIEEYLANSTIDFGAVNLISFIIIGISLIMLYFSVKSNVIARMEELVVYRLLGISKSSIMNAYLLEMGIMTALTSLPAVLLTSFVIKFVGSIPSLKAALYFPWTYSLALIVIIFIAHMLISLLPVYHTISKPPAQLALKS